MSLAVAAMPDYGRSEALDVCLMESRLAKVAKAGHLIHSVLTSLLLYSLRPLSGVLVEVCLHLASQQASSHQDAVWEVIAVVPHGCHWDLAVGVLQVVVAAVVEPCSQVEALWRMLAGGDRESRLYSPYPIYHSSLLGMDDTPSLPRPHAAQGAPTYHCLGSHRPSATLEGRPGVPII